MLLFVSKLEVEILLPYGTNPVKSEQNCFMLRYNLTSKECLDKRWKGSHDTDSASTSEVISSSTRRRHISSYHDEK
jgi:hypothetical protein